VKGKQLRTKMLRNLNASVLFTREKPAASAKEIVGWWEARRPIYNLAVGTAGIFSCMVAAADVFASRYLHYGNASLPDPPLLAFLGIFFYALAANLCYTGGWLAELLVRKISPTQSDRLAILSFKYGLTFSILLSLFPAFIFGGFGLIAAWPRIFGGGQH
jgi:hypothetical protein